MKKLLLITAAVLGLAGTAWADDALEDMAKHDSSIAKIINEEKAAGTYGRPNLVPQEDLDRAAEYNMRQDELHLRKMGMSPATARKAIWAASHKPNSACAYYVRQLTADYDGADDRRDYDDNLIISIEHSGTCERKNLH
ncbi:hypothetical protein NQF86_00290 [Bombella sp. TMW 2.2543]|uniref:SCP domain-containing protein n=1 Tax=Bombella pluederhausensis TaxID=2967336 RepID=A0ABT3WJU7_9PROT|nr:hypothetical protein [Bombella pluederhausensis]MCX5617111.1 hypothetical protein [Bombella pluederhausensis]